ncbi:MAG: serine protease [Alcanivorax sp.]|uniref:S1 family peptidase n=1 Tax=Alcanivorax sp. TaxID=1872427 RepID=UPI00260D44E7|nr:serine protease [Alcanivorax sp.]MDF1723203.1 serine protease [Alcanivorax sp.]
MFRHIALLAGLATLPFSSTLADTATARIVGGDPAPVDRWPWMAQLAVDDPSVSGYLLCGASQLSPEWLVTAAHCMEYLDGSPAEANRTFVFIGDTDRNNVPQNGIPVRQILLHRQYQNLNRDLALLRIDPRSNTLWPSIISNDGFNALEQRTTAALDESVTALGWGDTGNGNLSNVLREVQLDYIPQQRCRELSSLTITNFAVCAAELNPINGNNQDSCFGDSGGPLFLDRDPQPWLVGLTSFGLRNCATGAPSGYTHLSAETAELEFLTDSAGIPLVDLLPEWPTPPPEYYYQPPGGSQTLTLVLKNDSKENTVTNPILGFSLTGNTFASGRWSGCGGLLSGDRCRPVSSLAASSSVNQDLVVDGNGGTDQVVTVAISATANQDDYRRRNNRIAQKVVFSNQPDLTLSAVQQSGNTSEARVAVTLNNRSTINNATNGEIRFSLPLNTTLANADELGCTLSNPVSCPVGDLPASSSQTVNLTFASDTGENRSITFTGFSTNGDLPNDNDNSAKLTLRYPSPAPSPTGGGSSGGGAPATLTLLAGLLLVLRRFTAKAQHR